MRFLVGARGFCVCRGWGRGSCYRHLNPQPIFIMTNREKIELRRTAAIQLAASLVQGKDPGLPRMTLMSEAVKLSEYLVDELAYIEAIGQETQDIVEGNLVSLDDLPPAPGPLPPGGGFDE